MYSRYSILLLLVVAWRETLAQLISGLDHHHTSNTKGLPSLSPLTSVLTNAHATNTHSVHTKEPLKFLAPFTETFDVNNTGHSIDIIRKKHHPIGMAGTLSGGDLGDAIYSYVKSTFYWTGNTTQHGGLSNRLEVLVYYVKREYLTLKKALQKPDGVVQVKAKVLVTHKRPPNYLFCGFNNTLQNIQEPGKNLPTEGSLTYIWFISYPKNTVYRIYVGTFTDDETGKTYPVTTIEMPLIPDNYLTEQQFESFLSIKGKDGKPLFNPPPSGPRGDVTVKKREGVTIKTVQ